MKTSLREGLIIQHRPELLEGMAEIRRPREYTKEAVEEMLCQIKKRSEDIARIPDYQWEILGISYSGNKKAMRELKKTGRRIHIYYGVTQEDIKEESKRYSSLLTVLASTD